MVYPFACAPGLWVGRRPGVREVLSAAPAPGSAALRSAAGDRDPAAVAAVSVEVEVASGFAPRDTVAPGRRSAMSGSAAVSQLASNAAQPRKAASGWVTTKVGIAAR